VQVFKTATATARGSSVKGAHRPYAAGAKPPPAANYPQQLRRRPAWIAEPTPTLFACLRSARAGSTSSPRSGSGRPRRLPHRHRGGRRRVWDGGASPYGSIPPSTRGCDTWRLI
jgi:hypothetical protein